MATKDKDETQPAVDEAAQEQTDAAAKEAAKQAKADEKARDRVDEAEADLAEERATLSPHAGTVTADHTGEPPD